MLTPSLWHDQAPPPGYHPLEGDVSTQTVVVGGGFTGLWAAYYLMVADPAAEVILIEASEVGFGASGRNGGWCIPELAADSDRWDSLAGPGAGEAMDRAMHETVDRIEDLAVRGPLACDFVRGGELHLARNGGQEARLRRLIDSSREAVWLSADEAIAHCGASDVRGALMIPSTACLHPAKLVAALASEVVCRGVRIRTGTAAIAIDTGRVVTNRGTIAADHILIATEGYTADLRQYRRSIVPLSSMMVATEPLDPEILQRVGLDSRPVFADARHLVIYGQRTADDRLAFGGRVMPYRFGSAIPDPGSYRGYERVEDTLLELFPYLDETEFTHHWGGVMAVPRNWTPFIHVDRQSRVHRAGGLIGEGVAATNLAGLTLAAAVTTPDHPVLSLPWVRSPSRRWPIEPLRWVGIGIGGSLYSLGDRFEEHFDRPASASRWLNRALRR